MEFSGVTPVPIGINVRYTNDPTFFEHLLLSRLYTFYSDPNRKELSRYVFRYLKPRTKKDTTPFVSPTADSQNVSWRRLDSPAYSLPSCGWIRRSLQKVCKKRDDLLA